MSESVVPHEASRPLDALYWALAFAVCLGAIAASGCSSKSAASDKNVIQALEEYFEDECVSELPGSPEIWTGLNFPFDIVKKGNTGHKNMIADFDALAEAGLLRKSDAEWVTPNPPWGDIKTPVFRYNLTAEGAKNFRRGLLMSQGFCYSKAIVEEIMEITPQGPERLVVKYRYTLADPYDWVYRHEKFASNIEHVKKYQRIRPVESATLILTDDGWEHISMSGPASLF